jgi:hypothetical protein
VLYGVTLREIDEKHGGAAWLSARNVCSIDDFDDYLDELKGRVRNAENAHGQ